MSFENKLEPFQEEIQQEIHRILRESNFDKIFEKYGISGDKLLNFQCTMDLTKVKLSDPADEPQLQEYARTVPNQQIALLNCCLIFPYCVNC